MDSPAVGTELVSSLHRTKKHRHFHFNLQPGSLDPLYITRASPATAGFHYNICTHKNYHSKLHTQSPLYQE